MYIGIATHLWPIENGAVSVEVSMHVAGKYQIVQTGRDLHKPSVFEHCQKCFLISINTYSGNETTRFTATRTLGTSLLTVAAADMVIFIAHNHRYRRATKAGQTTLEQAKTVLSTSRILSQATKVRLRYKRVYFLGTANHVVMADMVIFIAP